jgi:S1-C subfamily serine protease
VVSRVVAGAPAARAGLRPGDVITAVDHLETHAADEVVARVSDHDVGEHVTIAFMRGGEPRSVQVGVDALPPPAVSRVRTSWLISAGAPSRIGGPQ